MARVLETRKRDQPSPFDPLRVLVVERDKTLRSSFVRSLGRRGLQVDAAESGAEAMQLIERHRYPVIVADPTLSAREGVSLIDELRSLRPEPSLILTTAEEPVDASASNEATTCVLRKPWNERQLRTALDTARESYRIRQASNGQGRAQVARVLLIDADVDTTERLLALLQKSEVAREIQHCPNVAQALRVMQTHRFDAVLLNDHSLGVARLEALEQLRAAAADSAVITLSDRLHDGQRTLRTRKSARSKGAGLPDDTETLRRIIVSGIERKQNEGAPGFLTQVDPLTQLASQAAFGERLEECLAACRRARARCAVMLINLASFSSINVQHGHEAGDTVLCEIGRRIQASVREHDAVARLSADEYAVLLSQVEEPEVCVRVAQRILGITGLPVLLHDDLEVRLRAHVGISMYPESCQSDALLRHAHDALCAAKRQKLDYVLHAPRQGAADSTAKRLS